MIDPNRQRQLQELEVVTLCTEILKSSRNELYLNMRFLDVSLSSFGYEADYELKGIGTDGAVLYYQPDLLLHKYRQSRILVNRAYLHMVFHCLFSHMHTRKKRAVEFWNLACDIAMESIIDGLYQKCVYIRPSKYRREIYARLESELKVMTAEGVYQRLFDMELDEAQYQRMAEEFYVDEHIFWEQETSPQVRQERQKQWDSNRERIQTEIETIGGTESDSARSILEQVKIGNRERYDYKQFLRKFSVMKEEMEVDPDSFDYIYYSYGMSLYGNMPLIEPLESREVCRIEEFVLVIDTSMSCSGDLVRHFLEETYSVLCESESYFRKINIHIIQCDDKIRSDHIITSQDEMRAYMQNLSITGQGGTDFRPAFEFVNQLINQGKFKNLRGLLYFTDGKGIYPVKMPVYDTAFVFIEDQYEDISVPPWAIKLILTREDES